MKAFVACLLLLVQGTGPGWRLRVSENPDRSGAVNLTGYELDHTPYIFLGPASGLTQVRFELDGLTIRTENLAPFDLGGTGPAPERHAQPYTGTIAPGTHVMRAVLQRTDGTQTSVASRFQVPQPPDDGLPPWAHSVVIEPYIDAGWTREEIVALVLLDDDNWTTGLYFVLPEHNWTRAEVEPFVAERIAAQEAACLANLHDVRERLLALGLIAATDTFWDGSHWAWVCPPGRTEGDCAPIDSNGDRLPPTEANGATWVEFIIDFSPILS